MRNGAAKRQILEDFDTAIQRLEHQCEYGTHPPECTFAQAVAQALLLQLRRERIKIAEEIEESQRHTGEWTAVKVAAIAAFVACVLNPHVWRFVIEILRKMP